MRRRPSGFTYIGLLLAVALLSAGLAGIGQVWHTTVQRAKEAELQFVGEEFRRAIKLYYDSTPGGDKQLPRSLEDLLRDQRYPGVRRYLRKVYVDPMIGKAEWGLIKVRDGIVGVHSLSEGVPFKSGGAQAGAPRRTTYADWKFIAEIALPPAEPVVQKGPAAAAPAPVPQTPQAPTVVETPVAEPPPAAKRPEPLPTERCERFKALDARACAASANRLGRPDSVCEASAASRNANCLSGAVLGPLSISQ